MSDGDDKFIKALTGISAISQVATGGAESQIHTQDPVSIKTRFWLPMVQSWAVTVAFCQAVGGLLLMTWGLAWLLDLDWDVRAYLLAWTGFLVIAWLASVAMRQFQKKFMEHQSRAVQSFAVTAAVLVLGLAVGSLLLTVRERFGWELASMVFGAGLILGAAGLLYNQSQDLVGGYWRRSPYEEAITRYILPALAEFLSGLESQEANGEVREEDPRWQQRASNGDHQYGVVARPVAIQDPAVEDWADYEDEDEELVSINPEAGNLIWFVRYAAKLPDLTIKTLTTRPAPMLPFEEVGKDGKRKHRRLRSDMIRRLLARGSTSDEVRVDGLTERGMGAGGFWRQRGQGATAEWVVERDEAQRKAEEMWRSVYKDELPVPDYWRDRGVELAA